MFNFLKSTFAHTSTNSEAEALVEEFVGQDGRLYPFDLKAFTAGVKFQNAEAELQRATILAILSWFENHPSPTTNTHNAQDRKAWQVRWKMSQVFLHMLKHKLPYTEQEVITLLDWSASKSQHFYFRGVHQVIKVAGDYLKNNPVSDALYKAIETLIQSIESERMSVENYRWVLHLRELRGDIEVSLPLVAGDVWA